MQVKFLIKVWGDRRNGPISIIVAITAEGSLLLPFFTDVLARDRTGDTLTIELEEAKILLQLLQH